MSPDEDEEQHLLLLEDYPLDATSSVLKSLSPAERSFGMEVRSPQILKRSRALFASAAITCFLLSRLVSFVLLMTPKKNDDSMRLHSLTAFEELHRSFSGFITSSSFGFLPSATVITAAPTPLTFSNYRSCE